MSESHPTDKPNENPNPNAASDYNEDTIRVLEGVEGIRKRPSMYVGDTGLSGLHHLIYEVVDNSIDEAMAGYCRNITVKLNVDGSVTIIDDGRGIPVSLHRERGVSALQVVLTEIHAGGKFDKKAYKVSGGLHGVGITAVNALSEWLEAEVRRDGKAYLFECERGEPICPVREVGEASSTGTRITFKPDQQIFPDVKFRPATLQSRLHDLAYLNPGLRITFIDEESGIKDEYYSEKGLVEFVAYLNKGETTLGDILRFSGKREIEIEKETAVIEVEVAMQYNMGYSETVYAYCNNINTAEGGTHISGFRNALTRTLNNYGKNNNLFKGDKTPTGEDFREGLTAVISVKVPEPQFGGQTKTRLGNPELEGIVGAIVSEQLSTYLEENPAIARKIMEKGLLAAEAREASRKARELARQRKGALTGSDLPGKLFDCIEKDASKCELFLVEGQSAGGTAVEGRDRNIQAILPLKGKILNVEKARVERVLANEEILNIIKAVGVGVGSEIDLERRNYDKIVVMTDADVDGSHIRTLLLTFFYRQMPDLVREGHVYVAQPPLYLVTRRKQSRYVQTDEEMRQELMRLGVEGASLVTSKGTRFQGEELKAFVELMTGIDSALTTLQRRGLSLETVLAKRPPDSKQLPLFVVRTETVEKWFATAAEMDSFLQAQTAKVQTEASPSHNGNQAHSQTGNGEAAKPTLESIGLQVLELHEIRTINRALETFERMGFSFEDLLPVKLRPGEEPKPRFFFRVGDDEAPLETLQGVVAAVAKHGRTGLEIRRYKGLGEMNAEELWNTTMDPSKRTLRQVTVENAAIADEMFRVLMGEQVEPRREFIERYALEVRNLDYHA